MIKIPNYLIERRNEIYNDVWKKYKAKGLRLVDLAKIFRMPTAHLFYILKKEHEKKIARRTDR